MVVWMSWLSALVAVPIGIFIRGLCISVTWGWFIAPVTGWRQISTVEAVGIAIFFSIVANQDKPKEPNYKEMSVQEASVDVAMTTFAYSIVGPLITLLYAWLWQTFLMPNSN
jgi:hypothetical protein